MARLAFRNLGQGKARLVISVGGVALALLLILALDAILAGFQRQVSAYIDNSGADVVVSQRGVRNMHMASSSLPASIVRRVERVPGVAQVTPFLYMTNLVGAGEKRELAYVIGLPRDASMRIPWKDVRGTLVPGRGQAVLDSGAAAALGVRSGGRIQILGNSFRVAGLAGGYSSPVSTIVFISLRDFERLRGAPGTVSFLWVRGDRSEDARILAHRLQATLPAATVQTRDEFAAQERKVVNDITTDIVTIMNLVGFLIGLAVVALTVYIATLSRRAEYGVLKAVGARNRYLYGVVLMQALYSVGLGLATGLALTLALKVIVPRFVDGLTLVVAPSSLLQVGIIALTIAGISALLPVRQIAGVDPAQVFKGRAT